MKKIFGLMTLCVILMASCQKETETADQYLDQLNSSSLNLNSTLGSNSTVDNNTSEFGRKHKHRRDSSCRRIPVEKLTQSTLDYIAMNFPDATIEIALRDKAGNFYTILKLSDGTIKILQFDGNGNFIKELEKKGRGPKDPRKRLTKLDPTALPQNILSYIDTNYTSANILNAGATPTGEFIVMLEWNGSRKAILFDANGNFVKELR